MTPLSHSRIAPDSGYLVHLRQKADGTTRAWLFLLTADFEPLVELGRVLTSLGQATQELAVRESCDLEERSVSRIEEVFADDSPAWSLGRVAQLREYTYADGTLDADRVQWHLEQILSGQGVARMVPVTGAVARAGESLFGREQARTELLKIVQDGPTMLLGPRRSGKTSLLQWLVDEPPPDYRATYLDLERIVDLPSLAVELCFLLCRDPASRPLLKLKELNDPALQTVPDEYDRGLAWRTALYDKVGAGWAKFLQRMFKALRKGPTLLLALDEFGDFLQSLSGSSEFQTFTTFVAAEFGQAATLRVVITGSRSLEYQIETMDVGAAFNEFRRFALPPFEEAAARRLFGERLRAEGIRPSRQVIDRALALAGHQVPYYLQMLADSLLGPLEPGDLADPQQVERAYRESLLGYPGQAHFDELERRLKSYGEYKQRRAGQQALRLIAERGEVDEQELIYKLGRAGIERSRYDALMVLLEEYFFVEKAGTCWRFRVPVLRDYALRYYPAVRL